MQKVITIDLNGHAYQLDESAYDALRAYLDGALVQLKDNPDRVEILADLEQAIAEKCNRFLGPHKSVVTAPEVNEVLKEMGPVEGADHQPSESGADPRTADQHGAAGPRAPRRLYRIREGKMWEGVCTGLGAFIGLDATVVRIVFVVLAFASFGWVIPLYLLLVWVIPEAKTSDERAAAYGQPFNAQELIDQVKKQTSGFADRDDWKQWKRQWRGQQRQWRAQHRAWRHQWRTNRSTPPPPWPAAPMPMVAPFGMPVFLMPIFSVIGALAFAGLAYGIFTLVTTGFVYGWALPDGMPLWVGVLLLVGLYHVVTAPTRVARHSIHRMGPAGGWFAACDGLIGLAVGGLLVWGLFRHMPPVADFREFMTYLPDAAGALWRDVSGWFLRFANSF